MRTRLLQRVKLSRRDRRAARSRVRKALRRAFSSRYRQTDTVPDEFREVAEAASESAGELEDVLLAETCRESFYFFFKTFWSTIVPETLILNWHIRYICTEMQKVAERVFRNEPKKHDLVLNISPGTSKSTICSVMFAAWVWTRMPSARLLCCSFSEKLANRLGGLSRDVVKSDLYRRLFPEVVIRPDKDAKSEFGTTKGGIRFSVGSGTQVMGSHAHFILIDDPIDPQGVLSDSELARINNWIEEQLSGRKVDKEVTVTVMIAQRLHQDDPPAVMGEKSNVKWVRIPAALHDPDSPDKKYPVRPRRLAGYYRDGLMDPKRLTWSALRAIQEGPRGAYILSGQYGQRPVPPGGGTFKVDRLNVIPSHTVLPRFKVMVRFWDKAGTVGGKGSYTVGLLMGMTHDKRTYILDVIRCQVDSFTREKLIRQTARLDGKHVVVGLEQSGGEGGKESLQNTIARLAGYKVMVIRPGRGSKVGKGKEERAEPFSVQVNAGNVYVLDKHWRKQYVSELGYFPFGSSDDQVDASSGSFSCCLKNSRKVGGMSRGGVDYKRSQERRVVGKIHRVLMVA